VPIPILDEEICRNTAVRNRDIWTQVVDYGKNYPNNIAGSLGEVNYEQLFNGEIEVQGKKLAATPLSSYAKAREIAGILKTWIKKGEFTLTEPVQTLPGLESGATVKSLRERPIKQSKSERRD